MANENSRPRVYIDDYFNSGIPFFEVEYIGKNVLVDHTGKKTLPHPMNIHGYEGLINHGTRAKPLIVKDENFVLRVDPETLRAKVPKTKKNLELALKPKEWKEALVTRGWGKDEDGNDAQIVLETKWRKHVVQPQFKRVVSESSIQEQMMRMQKIIEKQLNESIDKDEDVVDTEAPVTGVITNLESDIDNENVVASFNDEDVIDTDEKKSRPPKSLKISGRIK